MNSSKKITRQIITIVCLGFVVLGTWYFTRIISRYSGGEAVWVYIPEGATKSQVKDSLTSALGDNFGGSVAMLWGGDAESARGAYRIVPGDKAWRVARRLDQSQQTPVRVTFNNVRTLRELADRLGAYMEFTPEEFMESATEVCRHDSISMKQLESEFLPDTYETYWTAEPAQLMNKIRDNYRRFWNDERKKKAKALGLSPLQVTIIASIVEEESNRSDERGKIARLYLNRLAKGMKLQADPTVKFAKGDFSIRRITSDMLAIKSPYNTYAVNGLPPGIIRMPEARTIDQVLDAPGHNFIYMCARPDGSGYHNFTSDYQTHLKNAQAFRKYAYGK
ncbi:MAG: endolytic transglycosylase MltG [Bacteroidales bacterium]|nr:endolytic transglycosylase MltG [Bacteroidales bacterium]